MMPLLLLLIVLLGTGEATSNENVYMTSGYGQLVTSSTLRWEHADSSSSLLFESFLVRSDDHSPSVVCRGWHKHQLLPGRTNNDRKCIVGFLDKHHELDKFQVMVDRTQSARTEWTRWDIFTKVPLGAIAYTDKTFVARFKTDSGEFVLGDLKPRRGLSGDIAVYFDNYTMEYVEEGEVLKEIEPVRYELEKIRFDTRRIKVTREAIELGRLVLTNSEEDNEVRPEWGTVQSVIAYNASYKFYWGQLPGVIKALPASGESYNRSFEQFKWGLPLEYERHRIQEVSAVLRVGTAVNVTAHAYKTTREIEYSARLVSVFADDVRTHRIIDGTYLETVVSDFSVDESAPYFTETGRLAPTTTTTTTTPSTTTPRSTTTMSAPTTSLRPLRTTTPIPTEPNPLLRFYPNHDDDDDVIEEEISNELSPMMSDQAHSPEPASLKENSSIKSESSLAVLIILLTLLIMQ